MKNILISPNYQYAIRKSFWQKWKVSSSAYDEKHSVLTINVTTRTAREARAWI